MDWSLIKPPKTELDWSLIKPPKEEEEKLDWQAIKPPTEDITTPTPTQVPSGWEQRTRGVSDEVVGGVPPKPVQRFGLGEGMGVVGGAIKQLPQQIKAAVLQVTQGAKGASVANRDWADEYIKTATEKQAKFAQETIDKYGDISFLGIKLSDVASMPQSIAFSLTSMGAGLATGVPIGLVPIPGSRIVAWGAGTIASGKAAYEMSAYQIMQIYLDAKNEEKITSTGQGLTLKEENNLKQGFNALAKQYALWEAIPEAISNLAFVGLLTAPLTKMVGKTIAGKIVNKLAGMYGEELLTETITEIGQKGVMGKAGLPGGGEVDWTSPTEWVEAFKTVAPQTFLLTTIMGGTGTLILNTKKVVKSLNKEVKDGKVKDELIKKIENEETLKEAVKEETTPTTEKVPEVPVRGRGKVGKISKDIEANAIEAGLTEGFKDLPEFTGINLKDQAQKVANLINSNLDEARSIIRGEKPLPGDIKGMALIKGIEEYLKKNPSGEISLEAASSQYAVGVSLAAQELGLARGRDEHSPVKAIQDINKTVDETNKNKFRGKNLETTKTEATNKIKTEVNDKTKKSNNKYSWSTFLRSIQC